MLQLEFIMKINFLKKLDFVAATVLSGGLDDPVTL